MEEMEVGNLVVDVGFGHEEGEAEHGREEEGDGGRERGKVKSDKVV